MFTRILFLSFFIQIIPVYAGFIQIIRETKVSQENHKINIEMNFINKGNEVAKDISLDFPSLNKRFSVSQALNPNIAQLINLDFTKDELSINKAGSYLIPFKILYRDNNNYLFSSPQIISITHGELPSTSLSLEILSPKEIETGKDLNVLINVRNVQNSSLSLDKLEIFSATEFMITQPQLKQKMNIPKNSEYSFKAKIKNKSGLPDSNYQFIVIAEGEYKEKHISVDSSFFVKLVKSHSHSSFWIKIILLLSSLLFIGSKFWSQLKK